MYKFKILIVFFLLFNTSALLAISREGMPLPSVTDQQQDSLQKLQILYNGKVWRNLYMRVVGNQFLFSASFLNAGITMNGIRFDNLPVLYDIYNDELITSGGNGTLIELNKEMVDSFTLTYMFRKYRFEKISADTVRGFYGYVNVLYKGSVSLYLKYKKAIALLEVDDKYDKFYQVDRIFFVKGGTVYAVKNRRDLLKAMDDKRTQVKAYMRENSLSISKKDPDSFVPVVKYYDGLGN
ncbi:MAG TPA: hypothetical protein VJ963_04515 [Bacteroidales bacterium]|nr:hypothetical protein [Bacteroidales bacterium]